MLLSAAPASLLALVRKGYRQTRGGDPHQPLVELDKPDAIQRAVGYLATAPEAIEGDGGNATTYAVAARVKDFGLSEDAVVDAMLDHWNETRASPPWQPDDLAGIVANAFAYGTSAPGKLSAQAEFDAVEIAAPPQKENPKSTVPSRESLAFTDDELRNARLTPRCIVQDYLYCDVGQLVAAGGTSKTTLVMFEAIHIVLGRPIWGLEVKTRGWVLLVTAEDLRETLGARLEVMMGHLGLTEAERTIVKRDVIVWDVTGSGKKLIRTLDGSIVPSPLIKEICEAYRDDPPVLAVFDPLVSFGVSEQAVNDNEQGLITAARRMVKELGCCVRYIHHTGKSGRDILRPEDMNQYAGRGGSALADGTRMTSVMAGFPSNVGPPAFPIAAGQKLVALARPKVSYAPPNLPIIWLRRRGFTFDHFTGVEGPDEAVERSLLAAVRILLDRGQNLSLSTRAGNYAVRLAMDLPETQGLSRTDLAQALERLLRSGKIVVARGRDSKRRSCDVLKVVFDPDAFDAATEE